jgi:CMP/dCMP kinase
MANKLKYKNITISGLPGAGSSTLSRGLAQVLGWKYFSGGDFMRAWAIGKGLFNKNNKTHHDATVYNEEFDRKVDYGMRKTLKQKKHKIFDSWLSGFMAQGVGGVLKILVFCSRDEVRVDRIVNRDNITVKEAKKHIFEREAKNLGKWRRMYELEWQEWVVKKGKIDKKEPVYFWNPKLYDFVIDTYKNSKENTLKIVLKTLGFNKKIEFKNSNIFKS